MNYILSEAAKQTTGTKNRIDYPQLLATTVGYLGLLNNGTTWIIEQILRRQATLAALDVEGQAAGVNAYYAAQGGSGFLASYGLPVRSSHAGTPVDTKLPQGPYAAPPPTAAGPGATLRGTANYAWLRSSTTDHTTRFALPGSATWVASYVEITLNDIIDDAGTVQLGGGRVVYDPFNNQWFISEHYKAEFELVNVPLPSAVPTYAAVRADIQQHALGVAAAGPPWTAFYDALVKRMGDGEV